MKRMILMAVAAILVTMSAQAYKMVPGVRMEIGDEDRERAEFTLFTYMDDDETFGYYLSLGRVTHYLGIIRDDITETTIDGFKETCICLGSTYDEAYSALSDMLALYDQDEGTTAEFQGRASAGGDRLGKHTTSTCVVTKKLLAGKQLEFFFSSGNRKAHIYLPKQVVKDLRQDLKFDKKLHPKQHK